MGPNVRVAAKSGWETIDLICYSIAFLSIYFHTTTSPDSRLETRLGDNMFLHFLFPRKTKAITQYIFATKRERKKKTNKNWRERKSESERVKKGGNISKLLSICCCCWIIIWFSIFANKYPLLMNYILARSTIFTLLPLLLLVEVYV